MWLWLLPEVPYLPDGFNTLFFDRPEIVHVMGLDGPGRPRNHLKRSRHSCVEDVPRRFLCGQLGEGAMLVGWVGGAGGDDHFRFWKFHVDTWT